MRRWSVRKGAATVVAGYLLVSWAWVVGSDRLVEPFSRLIGWDPGQVEVVKGMLFVLVSALGLWILLVWQGQAVQASQRRWAHLASSSTDALFVVDLDPPRFRYANPAFERITGRAFAEFEADPSLPFQVVEGEGLEALRRVWVDPLRVEWPLVLRVVRPDGQIRVVELSGRVVPGRGGHRSFEGVVVDVTVQQQREQHLRDAATAAEAAAEYQRAAAAELARTGALKDNLLTSVAHELRTPVTVVLGMAETLVTRQHQLGPQQRDQLGSSLLDQARTLAGLVEDLRQFSLPEPRLPVLERIDVAAVVADVAYHSPVADRLIVSAPGQLWAAADATQLRRIAVELLRNVEKYAPHGPVTVTVFRDGPGWWQLEVMDEGPGLPEDELDQVMTPFHRVDLDHPSPGTGLGLALVARYVQAHQGRVTVQNGDGLTVAISLPDDPSCPQPRLKAV